MSYDLYCYKPTMERPDSEDAEHTLKFDEDQEAEMLADSDWTAMCRVADALVEFDPQLEILTPDFEAGAKAQNITIDEARMRFGNRIEINTLEGAEHYTQTEVWRDNVSLSCGLGAPQEVFDKILAYTEIIAKQTGYFLYDPQDGSVSDPLHPISLAKDEATSWSENNKAGSKPWWKFW